MKTNKQKQLSSLTWKYFKEQKIEEISYVLIVLFGVISVIGIVAQIGWANKDTCPENRMEYCPAVPYEPMFPRWIMFTGITTTGIWVIFFIWSWLESNYTSAKERAKKELKI